MAASGGTVATLDDVVRTYGDSYPVPSYPKPRAVPMLTREPLFRRTAPGGPMEQALMKVWLIDIYSRWESHYRTQLKREIRYLRGAIRPRQQVLGDLGHIRNDLLHNGIAKPKDIGRCEILRWFKVGEPMQVKLRHVFDLLNQMGWLGEGPTVPVGQDDSARGASIERGIPRSLYRPWSRCVPWSTPTNRSRATGTELPSPSRMESSGTLPWVPSARQPLGRRKIWRASGWLWR